MNQIVEFVYVAKHANLSSAAKELHLTQPALSRHIKVLEDEIGFELFDRSTSPMSLTPLGEQFLEHACRASGEWARLKAFVVSARTMRVEDVRLRGLVDGVTMPILRRLETVLTERVPITRMLLVPYGLKTPSEALRDGEIDIAIERSPASST